MSKQKIDALTPLRFIACMAIITCHSRGHFGLPTDLGAPYQFTQSVSFFFVLSGFIMAFVYPNLDGAGATGKYWLARFARIWPLHLIILLFYVLLLPELSHYDLFPTIANMLLVQSWFPNQAWFFSFNSVTWSIGTECFFYIAFPFLIKNFEKNWPWKLGFSFLLAMGMIQLANFLHAPSVSPDQVSVHGLIYINPLSRLFEFVVGMTAAGFYRKYVANRHASQFVGLGFEVFAIALLVVLCGNTAKIAHWFSRLPLIEEGGRMWIADCGISVITCMLLILVMAWGRGPISRLLASKPLVLLGEMSFSVYLLHRMFLHYYWNHFAPERGPWPMVIYLAMVLVGAYATWSLIEMPVRQLILRGPSTMRRPTLASCLAVAFVAVGAVAIWSGAPLERLDASTVHSLQAAGNIDTDSTNSTNTTKLASVTNSANSAAGNTGPNVSSGTNSGAVPGAVNGVQKVGDIAFGDDLRLLATQTRKDARGLTVTLYWQALRRQKINSYISTQLLSENNVLVRLKDYRQSMREETVEKGDCFKNELFLPASELQYVHRLAFGLVHPAGQSPKARFIDRAPQALPGRPELYKGLVAVNLASDFVAGKEIKPAL
jgi:peptidoglycan/LPS O-acetylase OafA/YrhL